MSIKGRIISIDFNPIIKISVGLNAQQIVTIVPH